MVAAAAAITGLVLTGTISILYNDSSAAIFKKQELTLGAVSNEYTEMETYYINQINKKNELINELTLKSTDGVDSETKSVLNDFDKSFFLLKQDLLKSPKQERIINAVIEHYQMKIDMLDQIIDTLNNENQNRK